MRRDGVEVIRALSERTRRDYDLGKVTRSEVLGRTRSLYLDDGELDSLFRDPTERSAALLCTALRETWADEPLCAAAFVGAVHRAATSDPDGGERAEELQGVLGEVVSEALGRADGDAAEFLDFMGAILTDVEAAVCERFPVVAGARCTGPEVALRRLHVVGALAGSELHDVASGIDDLPDEVHRCTILAAVVEHLAGDPRVDRTDIAVAVGRAGRLDWSRAPQALDAFAAALFVECPGVVLDLLGRWATAGVETCPEDPPYLRSASLVALFAGSVDLALRIAGIDRGRWRSGVSRSTIRPPTMCSGACSRTPMTAPSTFYGRWTCTRVVDSEGAFWTWCGTDSRWVVRTRRPVSSGSSGSTATGVGTSTSTWIGGCGRGSS